MTLIPTIVSTETADVLINEVLLNTDDPICCSVNTYSSERLELLEAARFGIFVMPQVREWELTDWQALYSCEYPLSCYIYITEPVGFGDIDLDGDEDLVVVLVEFPGGNWMSYSIAGVLRRDQGFEITPLTYIGGRISYQDIEIVDGVISLKLDMSEHQNWDQACWKDGNSQIDYGLEAGKFVCQPVREIPSPP